MNHSVTADRHNEEDVTYVVFSVEQKRADIDFKAIDRLLRENKDFACYQSVKDSLPEVLSTLLEITPDVLKDKCHIYRFPHKPYSGGLTGRTFLVYEDELFSLGSALGGYGVTEFAYSKQDNAEVLYYISSWGSGILRSHIGKFDFNMKQLFDFSGPEFQSHTIGFNPSEDAQTLGVCQATITRRASGATDVHIIRDSALYKDIRKLEFVAV